MFEDFINAVKSFSKNVSYIESVIIAGSYARGTNKKNSDLILLLSYQIKRKWLQIRTLFSVSEKFYENRRKVMGREPLFAYGIKTDRRRRLGL